MSSIYLSQHRVQTPRIYAHRGVSASFPENTLAAFQAALELGVDGIEFDVHSSADGVPVVIRDSQFARTTNGSGSVEDLTLAQISPLDAGDGERIPTFEEVVTPAGPNLDLDIEIKGKNCERDVLSILARYPDTRAAISSFDWEILANVRALYPAVELWVVTSAITSEAIRTANSLGCTTLAVYHTAITGEATHRASDAGLALMAWTVNSVEEATRLQGLGVASLCTDDPETIIEGLPAAAGAGSLSNFVAPGDGVTAIMKELGDNEAPPPHLTPPGAPWSGDTH